ncbi:hypothetical protein VULLAG_LOCUS15504 [Vulpes lagopus]
MGNQLREGGELRRKLRSLHRCCGAHGTGSPSGRQATAVLDKGQLRTLAFPGGHQPRSLKGNVP